MIRLPEEPVTTINVTRDELMVLVYAVAAWHDMTRNAPIIANQGISRSDAMRARRSAERFANRIRSLGQAYGIQTGGSLS